MREAKEELESPRRIGPYEVVERVRRGALSDVYRCREAALGRDLAVKVERPGAGRPSRLRREARVRAAVEHAGLLPLYRAGRSRWGAYLAGPWLPGGTLLERYGSLPLTACVSLAWEIGGALDGLHAAGWVHGDLNGRNVVFGGDGRAVLIDFGSARRLGARTAAGAELGLTPETVPPEVWRGGPADGRSDLYGLGVLLYRNLVGRYPFEGDEWARFAEQHCHQPVPLPSRLSSALGPRIEAALLRALEKEPAARFQTGSELATELSRAVAAEAGPGAEGMAGRPARLSVVPGSGPAAVRAAGARLERFAEGLSGQEREALQVLLAQIEEARARAESETAALTTELFAVPAALLALEQTGAAEALGDGAMTPGELAAACGAPPSTLASLLEVLAAAGLLGACDGRYSLPPPLGLLYREGQSLGASSRPVREAADFWSWLPEWARTREPRLAMDRPDGRVYSSVVETLASLSAEPSRRLAGSLRASGRLRPGAAILDVGAGSAVWSLAAAAGDPAARVTAVDRPAVLEVARANAEAAGLGARFEPRAGDWRTVPFPAAAFDLVLVANLCHLEPGGEVAALLRRLRPVLRPGGRLAIVDTVPEDRRTAPLKILLAGLRLALRTPNGGIHDLVSYRRWLREAGLSLEELVPLLPDERYCALIAGTAPRD